MFSCPTCRATVPRGFRGHQCPGCAGPLDLTPRPTAFPRQTIEQRPAGMWRYAEALPHFAQPVSLGECLTPLVPCAFGSTALLLKWEPALPTGSYKDRGAALLISYLHALGVGEAV